MKMKTKYNIHFNIYYDEQNASDIQIAKYNFNAPMPRHSMQKNL